MSQLVIVLLVGWGVGWFTARSVLGDILVRRPITWIADRATARAREGVGVPALAFAAAGVFGFLQGMTACAGCTGFWTGLALGWWHPLLGTGHLGALATGFAVMGVNAVVDALTGAGAAVERSAWAEADRIERELAPTLPHEHRLSVTSGGQ